MIYQMTQLHSEVFCELLTSSQMNYLLCSVCSSKTLWVTLKVVEVVDLCCICRSAKKRVKTKKMRQLYRRKKTEDQDFH